MAKQIADPVVRRRVAEMLGGLPHRLQRINGRQYHLVIPPGSDGRLRTAKKHTIKGPPHVVLGALETWVAGQLIAASSH